MIRKKIDYVHANPVRKGLVATTREYVWSSFAAHHGLEAGGVQLDKVPR